MKPIFRVVHFDPNEAMEIHGRLFFDGPTSFASQIDINFMDFGSYLIVVDRNKICEKYHCYEVKYDFDWLVWYPSILYKITGKDVEDWLAWARGEYFIDHDIDDEPSDEEIDDIITREISETYGWENEIVVESDGVCIDIYPSDIIWMGELGGMGEYPEFLSKGINRIKNKSGWYNESYRHALASRGIRTR